jgi:hypothetical protein
MSYSRSELAEALRHLRDNGNWRHYVHTVEAHFNDRVKALLDSPMPDEALRGECRALKNLLHNINRNSGDLT